MANTFEDYIAQANQLDPSDAAYGFVFNFPYLEDTHVTVEVDGTPLSASNYTVQTSPDKRVLIPSGVTVGQKVRVRRNSNADSDNPYVDFVNGSVLNETDQDNAYRHNLYLNEELAGLNEQSLQKEVGGTNWDANSLKIVNVTDPTAAQDVATKSYIDSNDALKVDKTGDTMSGSLAMGANKVTGMADPTAAQDAATKSYVDTNDALKVSKTGDTMSGILAMGTNKVTGIGDPTDAQDAATKSYADTKVTKAGDTMSGELVMGANKVSGVANPTNAQDAATKTYVDTQVATAVNGSPQVPVKYAFTGDGSNAAFTFNPGIGLDADEMYEVAIDGVLQEPTTAYAIDADADTITFTSVPPNASKIVVINRGYTTPVVNAELADGSVTSAKISDTDSNFNVQSDGKVGIGTDQPSSLLTVNGQVESLRQGGEGGQFILRSQNGGSYRWNIDHNGNNGELFRIFSSNDDGSGGSPRLNIDPVTGNVNIGLSYIASTHALNVIGDINTTGNFKVNGTTLNILSKYTSNWFNDTTGLANGGTYSFNHTLGTADINVEVFMAKDASGTDTVKVTPIDQYFQIYGAMVTDITSSAITVQLGSHGSLYYDTSGARQLNSWGTTYTHIKVVAIG